MSDNESNESRETVADIVADIRERAENAMRNGERLVHNEAVANMLTFVADRIEAAAEREHMFPHAIKVPIEVVPTGNAAAIRDALLSIRDAARKFFHQLLNSKYYDMMDTYKCRERGFPALLDLRAAIPKANFALAAPPRNCDRFADETDAQLAFLNEVWLISVDRESMLERDRYENWTDEMRARYGQWLFAPAAERKGEDNGSK